MPKSCGLLDDAPPIIPLELVRSPRGRSRGAGEAGAGGGAETG